MKVQPHPLVSVVTPVYNGQRFLRECIESVLSQTYQTWEYTLVNNCSTDGTLEIATHFSAIDPRIKVCSNDCFVRAIENYNIALRHASPASKYIKIVAADDWLFPECLERMVALAEQYPNVGIVGAFQLQGSGLATEGLPYSISVRSGREMCRQQLLGGPYVFGTPTTVLLRGDLVRTRHAFYNEANLHADDEACVEVLERSDFGFIHQILTFRRVDDKSLTSFSERFNTYSSGLLLLLIKYGPKHLSEEEAQRRIREVLREYYDFLGKALLKGRERQFWRFHQRKLVELGYPLSPVRILLAALGFVLDRILNPKSTVEEVVRRVRERA